MKSSGEHVDEDVAGGGVAPSRTRREVRLMAHGPLHQFLWRIDVVPVLVVVGRRGEVREVVVDPAGVLEELTDCDAAAVVAVACIDAARI
jgi:hypothetical protein